MKNVVRAACWILAAAALAVPVATMGPSSAEAAQASPSRAVITKLIRRLNAGENPNRRFKFGTIRVAKPHVAGVAEIYGIRGGTEVWPVLATFTVFTGGPNINQPGSVCDRDDQTQFFYFFKNQFGDWADGMYASSENKQNQSHPYSPCSTMPGSAIFTTPLPAGANG